MRYFARIAYKGTNYVGWQRQPKGLSVQEAIENAMSLILREKITVLGCGRTDAGVHASDFVLHFDFEGTFPKSFVHRLNKVLPDDIVFYGIKEVKDDAHARFDAINRNYEYHIVFRKNPFQKETLYFYPFTQMPDFDKLQETAQLLLKYNEFTPFCKTHSDAKTMLCDLRHSKWKKVDDYYWVYEVSSNRFLRGMIRLIVGACLNVATEKIKLEDVKEAMDNQSILKKSTSAPAEGLYLSKVEYDYF